VRIAVSRGIVTVMSNEPTVATTTDSKPAEVPKKPKRRKTKPKKSGFLELLRHLLTGKIRIPSPFGSSFELSTFAFLIFAALLFALLSIQDVRYAALCFANLDKTTHCPKAATTTADTGQIQREVPSPPTHKEATLPTSLPQPQRETPPPQVQPIPQVQKEATPPIVVPREIPPVKRKKVENGIYRAERGYTESNRYSPERECKSYYPVSGVEVKDGEISFTTDANQWVGRIDQHTGIIKIEHDDIKPAMKTPTFISGPAEDARFYNGRCGSGYFRLIMR
jgi:hypothetical protein